MHYEGCGEERASTETLPLSAVTPFSQNFFEAQAGDTGHSALSLTNSYIYVIKLNEFVK
jgi:hypothetical protein